MTTYIPTVEFVGLLNDVGNLAGQDPDDTRTHAIRIQWDGEAVHAMATDDTRLGISTWHPDDLPEEATQEGVFTRRGGRDDPWSVVVSLPDAVEAAKKFKVATKNSWVPLALDFIPGLADEARLRIARSTDCGLTGLSMVLMDRDVDFADIRLGLDAMPAPRAVSEIEFNGELLAAFGQVRQRGGGMKLAFTGTESMALVTIGDRFRGGIRPIRTARRLTVAA